MRYLSLALIAATGISGCRKSVKTPDAISPGPASDASHSDRSETGAPVVPMIRTDATPASYQTPSKAHVANIPTSKRASASSEGTDRASSEQGMVQRSIDGAADDQAENNTLADGNGSSPKQEEDLSQNQGNGATVTGRTYKRPVAGRPPVKTIQQRTNASTGGLRGPLRTKPLPNYAGIRGNQELMGSFVSLPVETGQDRMPESIHVDTRSDEELRVGLRIFPIADDSDEATVRWNQRGDLSAVDEDSISVDWLAIDGSLDSSIFDMNSAHIDGRGRGLSLFDVVVQHGGENEQTSNVTEDDDEEVREMIRQTDPSEENDEEDSITWGDVSSVRGTNVDEPRLVWQELYEQAEPIEPTEEWMGFRSAIQKKQAEVPAELIRDRGIAFRADEEDISREEETDEAFDMEALMIPPRKTSYEDDSGWTSLFEELESDDDDMRSVLSDLTEVG